jgi:hypothetical protein
MAIRSPHRTVFSVTRHPIGWAVEHEGQVFDACPDKETAKASANKRARAAQDAGHACQVRVQGEQGF